MVPAKGGIMLTYLLLSRDLEGLDPETHTDKEGKKKEEGNECKFKIKDNQIDNYILYSSYLLMVCVNSVHKLERWKVHITKKVRSTTLLYYNQEKKQTGKEYYIKKDVNKL